MMIEKIMESLELHFSRADEYLSEIKSYNLNLTTFDDILNTL